MGSYVVRLIVRGDIPSIEDWSLYNQAVRAKGACDMSDLICFHAM